MTSKESHFQWKWNLKKRTFLVEKYGTNIKAELMQKIAEDIFSNKEPNITPNLKTKIDEAKLKFWEAKAREQEVKATLAENQLAYITTFGSSPSPQAEKALQFHAENQIKKQNTTILKEDGTLKCITCGKIFEIQAYPFMQADSYRSHVKNDHSRELYALENQICLELANK